MGNNNRIKNDFDILLDISTKLILDAEDKKINEFDMGEGSFGIKEILVIINDEPLDFYFFKDLINQVELISLKYGNLFKDEVNEIKDKIKNGVHDLDEIVGIHEITFIMKIKHSKMIKKGELK